MKIITLNIWGGRIHKPLLDFMQKNNDVDIFCLQETFHNATSLTKWDNEDSENIFQEIQDVLVKHTGYTALHVVGEWGLSMFIKNSISHGDVYDMEVSPKENGYVFKVGDFNLQFGQNIQYVNIVYNDEEITVINFHGLWNGRGKIDTDSRILQSKNIADFVSVNVLPCVLCGDYNLSPDTESLNILEKVLPKNLIKEYEVKNTRTSFYKKKNRFADYVLTDLNIKVKVFKVLSDEVSDHAALYLEI